MLWTLITGFGGMINGSFGLPMKYTAKWKWENTWSMWTIWTLLVVPWTIALITVPNLFHVYNEVGGNSLFYVFVFGFIWGFSAIAFGKGLDYLGLALGYSLMMGMIITVGSLLPLFMRNSESIFTPSGLAIILGVVVIVCGIILNAYIAVMKEKDLITSKEFDKRAEKKSFFKGVIICIIAGFAAPMLNYAFIYGDEIRITAENHGATKTMAPNAIWTITLSSGFIVNIVYCLFLVSRNKSWVKFGENETKPYYFYTLIMGVLWAGGIAIYGMATVNMGDLGPSIGWAVFNAMAILWANVLGLLTGEWKGVSRKTSLLTSCGLVVLLIGICIVGLANTL